MLRKRLIGVITVRDGWAVQSFGYRRYLPLGRPEVIAENLDRWGADEILVQCIDASARQAGPDLDLLRRTSRLGLSTPLIYGGGIRTAADGVEAVKAGADRVCIDALLHDDPAMACALSEPLGAQAVIAALPLSLDGGELSWLDYRRRTSGAVSPALMDVLASGAISEALVIDWRHEGGIGSFDPGLLDAFPVPMPLIAFGGLSEAEQHRTLLGRPDVAATAVGNALSYREHAVQAFKQAFDGLPIRAPTYDRSLVS
jgi:cyclase